MSSGVIRKCTKPSYPKIVETGLDLLDFPTILFHETGYSLHTLRQSSRRSWRIGQKRPVEVKFFAYTGTMQEVCLRLMGKKLLVALAMEGKFASEGLQALDGDDDMLTAMAQGAGSEPGHRRIGRSSLLAVEPRYSFTKDFGNPLCLMFEPDGIASTELLFCREMAILPKNVIQTAIVSRHNSPCLSLAPMGVSNVGQGHSFRLSATTVRFSLN